MPNIDNVSMEKFIDALDEMYNACIINAQHISVISSIFHDNNTNDDNITMLFVENLPLISELNIPILNHEDSKNVFAISTLSRRYINELARLGELSDKFEKHVDLRMHCVEILQKLKICKISQEESIRIAFMNRFKILRDIKKGSQSELFTHCIQNLALINDISGNLLTKTKILISDMSLIYMN